MDKAGSSGIVLAGMASGNACLSKGLQCLTKQDLHYALAHNGITPCRAAASAMTAPGGEAAGRGGAHSGTPAAKSTPVRA